MSISSFNTLGVGARETKTTPNADVVGSLLRPAEVLAAQKQLAAGTSTGNEFEAVEDRAVDKSIALQERVGLEVVTDGEMRRQSFQSQMTAAVSGFGECTLDGFLRGESYDEQGVRRVEGQVPDLAVASLKVLFNRSTPRGCSKLALSLGTGFKVQCSRKLNLGGTPPRFGNSGNVEMSKNTQRRDVSRLIKIVESEKSEPTDGSAAHDHSRRKPSLR